MMYHSFIKSALIFLSGNLLLKYNSAKIAMVRGAIKAIPATAVLFLTGFFVLTGAPPFGIFFTKVVILSAGIKSHPFIVVLALALMAILFIGFLKHTVAMVFGQPLPAEESIATEPLPTIKETTWLLLPPLALIALVLLLSFYIPPFLQTLLQGVAMHY